MAKIFNPVKQWSVFNCCVRAAMAKKGTADTGRPCGAAGHGADGGEPPPEQRRVEHGRDVAADPIAGHPGRGRGRDDDHPQRLRKP